MKKIFSLAAVTGMFMLMSFSSPSQSQIGDKIIADCFSAADQAERVACGSEHCNDGLWNYVYDLCLFMQ